MCAVSTLIKLIKLNYWPYLIRCCCCCCSLQKRTACHATKKAKIELNELNQLNFSTHYFFHKKNHCMRFSLSDSLSISCALALTVALFLSFFYIRSLYLFISIQTNRSNAKQFFSQMCVCKSFAFNHQVSVCVAYSTPYLSKLMHSGRIVS